MKIKTIAKYEKQKPASANVSMRKYQLTIGGQPPAGARVFDPRPHSSMSENCVLKGLSHIHCLVSRDITKLYAKVPHIPSGST